MAPDEKLSAPSVGDQHVCVPVVVDIHHGDIEGEAIGHSRQLAADYLAEGVCSAVPFEFEVLSVGVSSHCDKILIPVRIKICGGHAP